MILLLLTAGACGGRLGWRDEVALDQTVPVPEGASKVSVRLRDGDVSVVASEGDAIRLHGRCLRASDSEDQLAELKRADVEFAVTTEGGVVVFQAPDWPPGVDPLLNVVAYRVVLELPRGLDVSVRAETKGHLTAKEIHADIELQNRFGDLFLMACEGRGVLRSERSKVLVEKHLGSLDVRLKSGDMALFVDEIRDPGVDLRTDAGNIMVFVPKGQQATLDASTGIGRATNGLGVPVEELPGAAKRMVGGQGPLVRMRTGAGNVSIGSRR